MSSITRVLHTTTWDYFTEHLPDRFIHSPQVVKEAIMTGIDDLVQEFWRTSSDDVEASLPAICCLNKILKVCLIFLLLRLPLTYLRKIYSVWQTVISGSIRTTRTD